MNKFLKIFYWGFIISFLGSLPLGTMNVTATNISLKQGAYDANAFALGTLVIEVMCVYIVLQAMQWVSKQQQFFKIFEWLTALLIFILSVSCFIAALKMKSFGNSVFTKYDLPPFVLGLLLSILNPLHIPFWFGWSTVLLNKKILIPQQKYFFIYITGISLGTIAGFNVFIYGGNYIVQQLMDKQNILNWVVGFVLLITASIQVYKIQKKKLKVEIFNVSAFNAW
jgi:threonine/homoserine/homoserine lactone efflux protein